MKERVGSGNTMKRAVASEVSGRRVNHLKQAPMIALGAFIGAIANNAAAAAAAADAPAPPILHVARPDRAVALRTPHPSPHGFIVRVSYSPRAAAALRHRHEGVVVWASWFGDPTPEGRRHADRIGRIDLGHERVTHDGPAPVFHITGAGLLESRLSWVKGQRIGLNVNIFSARRSGPDNILSCSNFDSGLVDAQRKSIRLRCKLIKEDA